jgi:epoxyqueuosine reductase
VSGTCITRAELGRLAREAGLTVTAVTGAEPFSDTVPYLVDHVARGYLNGMSWFTTQRAVESCEPRTIHTGVRSIVSVGVPFWSGPLERPNDGILRGRIARYAWGRDYHVVLKSRMRRFVDLLAEWCGRPVESRAVVDTARIVDRAVAARSGLGWYGKNTMIIVPGHGSWVMLGDILLDIDLPPDPPLAKNCGQCRICIDRCPTGAIVEPYRIDARRCISYLTIEERGPIARELRPLMGDMVFGCDVCQAVCPYTSAATITIDPDFAPSTIENAYPSLEFLARMSDEQFRTTYRGTAIIRAKRRGMARNAAVALGNSGDARAEPILRWMLQSHDEPLARGHAAWALRRLAGDEATVPLRVALGRERDNDVMSEIREALAE